MENSKVIINRKCISYFIQELIRFIYVTMIFAVFLGLAIFLSFIRGQLLNVNDLIYKDLAIYGIWLLVTYVPTFFKQRIFIYRVETINDFIKVNWQTRKEKKEIICDLQKTTTDLTISRGARGTFTFLTLTFNQEINSTELKQFFFPKWNLEQMQFLDNAIKEAQANLLKERN